MTNKKLKERIISDSKESASIILPFNFKIL